MNVDRPDFANSAQKRTSLPAAVWVALALLATLTGSAIAQSSGGNYTLRKQVVAPGGAIAAAGFRIEGTLTEAGAGTQSGGGFRLTGGFQTPRPPPDALFADDFEFWCPVAVAFEDDSDDHASPCADCCTAVCRRAGIRDR